VIVTVVLRVIGVSSRRSNSTQRHWFKTINCFDNGTFALSSLPMARTISAGFMSRDGSLS
jgi:hypothetical protein